VYIERYMTAAPSAECQARRASENASLCAAVAEAGAITCRHRETSREPTINGPIHWRS